MLGSGGGGRLSSEEETVQRLVSVADQLLGVPLTLLVARWRAAASRALPPRTARSEGVGGGQHSREADRSHTDTD